MFIANVTGSNKSVSVKMFYTGKLKLKIYECPRKIQRILSVLISFNIAKFLSGGFPIVNSLTQLFAGLKA